MYVLDLHADIGYDVLQRKKQGSKENTLREYHLPKLRAGGIKAVCMASFFAGTESWEDMQEMILTIRAQIDACKEDVRLILCQQDLQAEDDRIQAIMSVEGMCGIRDHAREKVRWMWDAGVRIASLCWNDENALATGTKGNAHHGLHELGREALAAMKELGMIVDVSHANETTFWDILQIDGLAVIATHSNCYQLCAHPRNLKDEQLMALRKRQGLIGMNSAPAFIDEEKAKRDCAHLVRHAKYIQMLQQGSVDGIACGFDFMDFYDGNHDSCRKLEDCRKTQEFVRELKRQGFTPVQQQAIAYENAKAFLLRHLPK